MNNKRLLVIIIISELLLLIPLIAMQFTSEVNWDFADFAVAGILILITAFSFEFILRKVKNIKSRIALITVLLTLFLLIWAELAVGIF